MISVFKPILNTNKLSGIITICWNIWVSVLSYHCSDFGKKKSKQIKCVIQHVSSKTNCRMYQNIVIHS